MVRRSKGNLRHLEPIVSAIPIEEMAGVVSIKKMSDNMGIALR